MDGTSLISFKDYPEYVFFVKKKLKGECLMDALVGFPVRKAFYFHGVVNDYPGFGVDFKGNFFYGP